MGKLGTQFTPITTPAGTRLLTLMDETTGERFKINITDFFALVASGATWENSQIIRKQDGYLELQITGTSDKTMRIGNGADGLTPSIQAVSNVNVVADIISWNHGVGIASRILKLNQGENGNFAQVLGSGNLENTNNSYGAISDETLKENITDAKSQWNDIKAVRLRNFNLKADEEKTTQLGVVAQEIEKTSKGLIQEHDGGIKGVKYSVLYLKAIGALQEAMTRIEALEAKLK